MLKCYCCSLRDRSWGGDSQIAHGTFVQTGGPGVFTTAKHTRQTKQTFRSSLSPVGGSRLLFAINALNNNTTCYNAPRRIIMDVWLLKYTNSSPDFLFVVHASMFHNLFPFPPALPGALIRIQDGGSYASVQRGANQRDCH